MKIAALEHVTKLLGVPVKKLQCLIYIVRVFCFRFRY